MTQGITLHAVFATYLHISAIKFGAVTSRRLRFDLEDVANIPAPCFNVCEIALKRWRSRMLLPDHGDWCRAPMI